MFILINQIRYNHILNFKFTDYLHILNLLSTFMSNVLMKLNDFIKYKENIVLSLNIL